MNDQKQQQQEEISDSQIPSNKNNLLLNNSLDESQLVLIMQNQKYHDNICFKSFLIDKKSTIIWQKLKFQNQLMELAITIEHNCIKTNFPLVILATSLGHLVHLKVFSLTIESQQNYFSFNDIGINMGQSFRSLQDLDVLKLSFSQASLLEIEGATSINKGIKSLQKLKTLTLQLQFQNTKNDEVIQSQFYNSIEDLQHLKELRIFTTKQTNIIKQGSFQLNLRNLIHLEILRIEIGIGIGINQQNFEIIQSQLRDLKVLKHLHFNINNLKLPPSVIQSLYDDLFMLEGLEELETIFNVEGESNLPLVIGGKVKKQSKIKKLFICLSNIESNRHELLLTFGGQIKNIHSLIDLQLQINDFQLGNIDQTNLFNWITKSKDLQRLYLQLYDKKKQISSKQVGNSISNLQRLKELHLFISQNINKEDDQFKMIKSISNLKNLERFKGSNLFNLLENKHFSIINLSLKIKMKIKQFSYNFGYNTNLMEIRYIASFLDYFSSSLEILEINFLHVCYYQGVELLAQQMKSLVNLKIFRITMNNAFRLDTQYIQTSEALELALGIKNLINLQELVFTLRLPIKNERSYFEQLLKSITELKELKYLYLTGYKSRKYPLRRIARKNLYLVFFEQQF